MDLQLPPNVRLALALTAQERGQALAYIERIMQSRFGGTIPQTDGVIVTARYRRSIVGTIALEGCHNDEPFPIERHYTFAAGLPFPCERTFIVQGSRWVATKTGVSKPIVQTAMMLANRLGKHYMLIEAKPYSITRLAELNIACMPISEATLALERVLAEVGEEGMPYYRTLPAPQPYLIDLAASLNYCYA